MNAAAIATTLLVALLKTTGEGGTVAIPYDTSEACEIAGMRLESQFEALTLEDRDQAPVEGHPRVVWTCFPVEN